MTSIPFDRPIGEAEAAAPTLREQLAAVDSWEADEADEVEANMPSEVYDDEPPARRQIGQRWRVYLDDDSVFEVRTTNRDMIAWERTKARHREWPTAQEAPVFATTFMIWTAARTAGLTAAKFDPFADSCLDFEKLDEEPADPTR